MKNNFLVKHKIQISEIALILLVFCFAFGLRLWLLVNTNDFHGISNGNIIRAQLLLNNDLAKDELFEPVHPPLHILLLMVGIKAFNDPVLGGRLISLFFGSLFLLPFYYCIKFLFDQRTAVFSMLAAAVYSEHVVYSVIATSEVCFHFFLFLSLFLLLSFFRRQSIKYLFISALCLGLASLCRYEGLLFVPLFAFALKGQLRRCCMFMGTALILPAIWMYVNFINSGDALRFINTNNLTVPLQFSWIRSQGIEMGFMEKILFWPMSLVDTLGAFMYVSGIAGILYCLFKRKNILMGMIFSFLFFVFMFKTVQESLYLQPRYGITLGLLLIPYSIFCISQALENLKKYKIIIPSSLILLLIASMIPPLGQRVLGAPLYAPLFAKKLAAYMHENIKESDNIFFDHCGDEKYKAPIKVLSGLNPRQFVFMAYLKPKDGQFQADREMFFQGLEKAGVSILIYSPGGDLRDILELGKGVKQRIVEDFKFNLLDSIEPYYVYSVENLNDAK